MGEDSNLSILIERITCLGRLPEHLLWEAAKAMALERSSSPGRRFAHLVEAGAMLDAAILLVGAAKPDHAIASIAIRDRNWTCIIESQPMAGGKTTGGKTRRIYQAAHVDLAAAVLMALLSSCLDRPQPSDSAGVPLPRTQREFEHHDF